MNIPLLTSGGQLIITVNSEKLHYKPGDKISGSVELRQGGSIHARSFIIALACSEFVNVSCGSGKHRRHKLEEVGVRRREVVLGGDADYSSCRRDFELAIPEDAPPTVQQHPGDEQRFGAGVKWVLHAKLDVPWGTDANAWKKIFVE